MSKKILVDDLVNGDDYYVVLRNEDGLAWNGSTFVGETSARPTFAQHRATVGTNRKYGPFTPAIGAATWTVYTTELTAGNESIDDAAVFLDEASLETTTGATEIDLEPVPPSRTFNLVRGEADELVGEDIKTVKIGPDRKYAVNFAIDMAVNQRISTVDSVAVVSGSPSGLTIGGYGRDQNSAKFMLTGVTAGDYKLSVAVTYSDASEAQATVGCRAVL